MDKVRFKLVVMAVLLLAVIGSLVFIWANNQGDPATNQQPATQTSQDSTTTNPPAQNTQQPTAKLTSSEDKRTVGYEGQNGKNALEILKTLAKVETKQSNYGEFVTSINGVTADGSTEFWAFYADGKLASEGAGTYKTKDGEKLEWRVEDVLNENQ